MKKYKIGFSGEFSYYDTLIKYEVSEGDNVLHLYIEDCARALGVTEKKVLKDGSISETVQWKKVYKGLASIGYIDLNEYKWDTNKNKYKTRIYIKNTTVTKEELISWACVSYTSKSNEFAQYISNINVSNIQNEIKITRFKRKELKFLDKLIPILSSCDILDCKKQYMVSNNKGTNYRIDLYIPSLNIAIEYDEDGHSGYTYEQHEGRQKEIEDKLGCKFIRVSDKFSDEYNIGLVIKELIPYIKNIA